MTAWIRKQTEFDLEVLIIPNHVMIKDARNSWTFGGLEWS